MTDTRSTPLITSVNTATVGVLRGDGELLCPRCARNLRPAAYKAAANYGWLQCECGTLVGPDLSAKLEEWRDHAKGWPQ